MEIKSNATISCFLVLFVAIQAFPSGPEDLPKYVNCATYAECQAGETGRQEIFHCIDYLKPEENHAAAQYVDKYDGGKSDNLYDKVRNYCKMDDAEKPNAFISSFTGVHYYLHGVCGDKSKKGNCSRIKKATYCYFNTLDKLSEEGKCKVEA